MNGQPTLPPASTNGDFPSGIYYSNGGARPETDAYIKWIDYTVRTLVRAVGQSNLKPS
jgi:hypothetical protein